jgi:PqqD family protein of HPr-rel-A system
MRYVSRAALTDMDPYLACFSESSGATHLLDAFPAEVLRLISLGHDDREQLARHLHESLGEPAPSGAMEDVLASLERLGLIEAVDEHAAHDS